MKVSDVRQVGSISHVALQVPQTFHRITCQSHLDLPEDRWKYFIDKVGGPGPHTPIPIFLCQLFYMYMYVSLVWESVYVHVQKVILGTASKPSIKATTCIYMYYCSLLAL